jgi:23S rRNA (guanine2445-N2)-methyltransferase / 23S rRNA (guanine2069-N7)-methyltransferase
MTDSKPGSEKRRFFAATAKGMEELLVEELKKMGAESVVKVRAGASFEGDIRTAYRACLWSRIANRVFLPLKTFPAPTPEKLYAGVKSIRWSEHLDPSKTFAIDFASTHSQITHTQFGALKSKDAIVDQFRSNTGIRPSVDVSKPNVRVNIYLQNDEATVSIDLSGESLHKRGYRDEGTPAPLKENLAAAILYHAEWPKAVSEGGVDFLDPMCGSGTLAIEAALIAMNRAPGLDRSYYGFLGWAQFEQKIWKELVEEAMDLEVHDVKKLPRIVGYDVDPAAIRASIANVERADLRPAIHIEKRELGMAERTGPKGILVVNPPYGERMGDVEELKPLYRKLGDTLKQRFAGWTGHVFTGSSELEKSIGLKASRRFVLYNGALECRLLKYELYEY